MTAPANSPVPVPERPLSLLDMADGAFAILRRRPRTVMGIAATFVLPVQLLAAWLDRGVLSGLSLDSFDRQTGQYSGDTPFQGLGVFGGASLGVVAQLAILPFIGVALTHLVLGWKLGEDRSTRQCLLFTIKKTHIILAALVISKLLQGVTLLLATPMTMLVAPIIAAEGLGPVAALRRSIRLGRRRYGSFFGLLLLLGVINFLLSNALGTLPTLAVFLLEDWGWVAFFALGSIGTTLLDIMGVGAAVLAYFDVTNGTEGADISRRLTIVRSETTARHA